MSRKRNASSSHTGVRQRKRLIERDVDPAAGVGPDNELPTTTPRRRSSRLQQQEERQQSALTTSEDEQGVDDDTLMAKVLDQLQKDERFMEQILPDDINEESPVTRRLAGEFSTQTILLRSLMGGVKLGDFMKKAEADLLNVAPFVEEVLETVRYLRRVFPDLELRGRHVWLFFATTLNASADAPLVNMPPLDPMNDADRTIIFDAEHSANTSLIIGRLLDITEPGFNEREARDPDFEYDDDTERAFANLRLVFDALRENHRLSASSLERLLRHYMAHFNPETPRTTASVLSNFGVIACGAYDIPLPQGFDDRNMDVQMLRTVGENLRPFLVVVSLRELPHTICASGGGIRACGVASGVLTEWTNKHGELMSLSAVSGGGYATNSLVSALNAGGTVAGWVDRLLDNCGYLKRPKFMHGLLDFALLTTFVFVWLIICIYYWWSVGILWTAMAPSIVTFVIGCLEELEARTQLRSTVTTLIRSNLPAEYIPEEPIPLFIALSFVILFYMNSTLHDWQRSSVGVRSWRDALKLVTLAYGLFVITVWHATIVEWVNGFVVFATAFLILFWMTWIKSLAFTLTAVIPSVVLKLYTMKCLERCATFLYEPSLTFALVFLLGDFKSLAKRFWHAFYEASLQTAFFEGQSGFSRSFGTSLLVALFPLGVEERLRSILLPTYSPSGKTSVHVTNTVTIHGWRPIGANRPSTISGIASNVVLGAWDSSNELRFIDPNARFGYTEHSRKLTWNPVRAMALSGAAFANKFSSKVQHEAFLSFWVQADMGMWVVLDDAGISTPLLVCYLIYQLFLSALLWYGQYERAALVVGCMLLSSCITRCREFALQSPLVRDVTLLLNIDRHSNEPPKIAYVCDGGHVENLGLVAAVSRIRRGTSSSEQCIIVIDSEEDPTHQMNSRNTATAILAENDIGITNGNEKLRNVNRYECPSFTRFEIQRQGNHERIFVRYLKNPKALQWIGDDGAGILPGDSAFPHTPTSWQFIQPTVFRAYHWLGRRLCNEARHQHGFVDLLTGDAWRPNVVVPRCVDWLIKPITLFVVTALLVYVHWLYSQLPKPIPGKWFWLTALFAACSFLSFWFILFLVICAVIWFVKV